MLLDEYAKKLDEDVATIAFIDHVGDNSKHQFLSEREWACIVEFPTRKSNRACFARMALEAQLAVMVSRQPDLCFDIHFALLNCPPDWFDRDGKEVFDGESARVKLYKNGALVAETDDRILLEPCHIKDGELFDETGYLLINRNGKSFFLEDDAPRRNLPAISALEKWIEENGVRLEPTPQDRSLWSKARQSIKKEISEWPASLECR